MALLFRGFINGFSRRVTGFCWRVNLFEQNFFVRKIILEMVKTDGRIIFTAGQFAQCPALNKTPACSPLKSNHTLEIVFEKGVSISCTEKDDVVYVFRGVVGSSETEMMQIRLKE